MANSFNTLKLSAATEKFNLVRIEPARAIEGSLALSAGTTYTVTFAFKTVSRVLVNGTAYTKVSSSPSSGEYTFNEDTLLLTINLGAALTTQIVTVYYYIFLSKNEDRITYQDPEDSTTTNRRWLSRIKESPSFSFNLSDITEGFLTFGSSSIVLNNQDGYFQQYLSDDDSFSNKEIVVWLCLDTVEHVKIQYRGIIKSLTVSKTFTINFFDDFSHLSNIYYSNGNQLNSTFNSTRFANINPSQENIPIRKLFAEVTTYKVISDSAGSGLFKVDNERLLEAVCINFSETISTSNNRIWGTILSDGNADQTDTVQSLDTSDPSFEVIGYTAGKKYNIGDSILISSSPDEYLRIYDVDTGANTFKTTKLSTGAATSETITRPAISVVIITQGDSTYQALYNRDYTLSYSSETNDIIKLTFTNNFEATLGCATLDPTQHKVTFRAYCKSSQDLDHADVISEILTDAGVTVNSSSITQANSDLSVTTNFYIPYYGEDSFVSYKTILEDLLKSTFGYLSFNNDQEFEYGVFKALSASSELTNDEILKDSFNISIDYNDLKSTLKPENPHDIITADYTNSSLENSRALYLHEVKSLRTYNHLLADTSRMQKVLDVLSKRKLRYTLNTKTNPDAIIGDQFTITRDDLLGNSSSDDALVLGINKKAEDNTIEFTDLLGI